MKVVVDRVVQYANRYKLTNAETGEVLGTYDFEEVTGTVQEEGTEINKELFDSIQVDLNNKLDKVTTPHVTRRAYIVDADGVTQGVLDIQVADIGNTLVMRGQDGSVLVSTLTSASDNRSAAPKNYVDEKYNDTVHISEQTLSEAEREQALENLNVPNVYAKQNGTYPNLHAGYASMDGNGNTITEFYATKTELAEEAATRAAADTALGGRIDDIVDGTTTIAKATDADSATKATQDGNGNVITDTYATKAVATQTSDGLMSAEDKVALDTLADTVDFDTIVRYTKQTGITEEQQTQAQENIGLPAQSAISRYNLGAFDTYVDNGDGTATITRQTYYLKIDGTETPTIETNRLYIARNDIRQYIAIKGDDNAIGDIRVSQGVTMTPTQTYQGSANGVSYNNSATTLQIQISQDFMGQTLNTVEAAQKYFGAHPLYIQLKLATSYTEDVISERPINTLDQNGSEWVREEWEKGLNLLSPTYSESSRLSYSNGTFTLTSAVSGENIFRAALPNGTYTISLMLLSKPSADTSFSLYDGDSNDAGVDELEGYGAINTYNLNQIYSHEITISKGLFRMAIWGAANNPTFSFKMWINKGGMSYPFTPYHGGIIRENSTRLLRRSYCNNASIVGTAWHRVGTVPQSVIGVDTYQNYSGIFLISSVHAANADTSAGAGQASGLVEFDVVKDPNGLTPYVSILSGNIPANSVCAVVNGLSCDLYVSGNSQYNGKQISLLSESTEVRRDEDLFIFNTNNDWSASAPSGAVYAVNRNTSSLEANGGTVNGDINVTGTVSELGQRVYSPNNPPPASSPKYCHQISLNANNGIGGSSAISVTFLIINDDNKEYTSTNDIISAIKNKVGVGMPIPASGTVASESRGGITLRFVSSIEYEEVSELSKSIWVNYGAYCGIDTRAQAVIVGGTTNKYGMSSDSLANYTNIYVYDVVTEA